MAKIVITKRPENEVIAVVDTEPDMESLLCSGYDMQVFYGTDPVLEEKEDGTLICTGKKFMIYDL